LASEFAWERPEQVPGLAEGGLQVWRLDARGDAGVRLAAECLELLSAEERVRAGEFRVELARREFVVGRGLLRRLLGAALGCDPKDVEVSFGENGKPQVTGARGVEFNLSHSGGLILAAVSRGSAVGIDVEWVDAGFADREELWAIADANFALEDVYLIGQAGSDEARLRAFYEAWTRKEAVSKVDGQGIAVARKSGEGAAGEGLMRVSAADGWDDRGGGGYLLRRLALGEDFVGAVARAGEPVSAELFDAAGLFGDRASGDFR
jgi:4'-phosphopantetheinyl transferase